MQTDSQTTLIQSALRNLETERNIRILYAVESGSRAWGFASPDSDWDVRFLYIHPQDWYLSISDQKETIEQMLPGDIDLSGWELRKALRLFGKSNPPLLEWLSSPIVYQENGTAAQALRNAAAQYLNPKSCMWHYLSMAHNNWTAYFKEGSSEARLKKYFYILRPLMACRWILERSEMAPMLFEEVLEAAPMADSTRAAINDLTRRKMAGDELSRAQRDPAIDAYIEQEFAHLRAALQDYHFSNYPGDEALNQIFREQVRR